MLAQAEPLAQTLVEEGLKPAATSLAERAEPAARGFTQEVLRPNAAEVAAEVRFLDPER